jgi:hypothetical protein
VECPTPPPHGEKWGHSQVKIQQPFHPVLSMYFTNFRNIQSIGMPKFAQKIEIFIVYLPCRCSNRL